MRRTTGTSPRRGVVALAALALLPAVLTACSGSDPKAGRITDTPTPTQSASSPSPSATTPEQQIEAAVNHYYAEMTEAAQTGDASTLATLSTEACPCRRPVRVINANERKGYRTPDAAFDVTSIDVHDVEAQLAGAVIETDEAAYDVLRRDGSVVGHVDARHNRLDLTLVLNQGVWLVANEIDLTR